MKVIKCDVITCGREVGQEGTTLRIGNCLYDLCGNCRAIIEQWIKETLQPRIPESDPPNGVAPPLPYTWLNVPYVQNPSLADHTIIWSTSDVGPSGNRPASSDGVFSISEMPFHSNKE
jgi:hypothetical protein